MHACHHPSAVLQTALALEDVSGSQSMAAATAAYIRRSLRARSPDAAAADPSSSSPRALSSQPHLRPLTAALTARLEALDSAAVAAIAPHLLLSEAPLLPEPLRTAVLQNQLATTNGTVMLPTCTDADAGSAPASVSGPATTESPSIAVLQLCADVLPTLPATSDAPALRVLCLCSNMDEAAARRVLASGVLGLSTLQELQLDAGRLPVATVAALIGEVSAATALSIRNLTHASPAQSRREGAGESLQGPASPVDVHARGSAGADEAPGGDGVSNGKRAYDRDPSPGRPAPFPLLRNEPMRSATADELRGARLSETIGGLTALQRLTLHPAPSCGRRFWGCLERLAALESLDVAFYGGTDDSSSRSGSPELEGGAVALPAGGGVAEDATPAHGLVDAREAFLRLQDVTGLRELQVHAWGLTERAEEVRLPLCMAVLAKT